MYTQAMDIAPKEERKAVRSLEEAELDPVSYTHLTLPTKA